MTYPRVSYSALEKFEACSTRLRLHIERKRQDLDPGVVVVGNALHYGLAAHVDSSGLVSIMDATMWEFERRLRENGPRWGREKVTEEVERARLGAQNLAACLEGYELDPLLARSEVRLFRHYRGWSIDGYLDLLYRADGRLEVWDLKSGSWHRDQLVFYDVLCEEVLGVRPDVVGIIEPLGRGFVEVPVTDEYRVDMRSRIKRLVERVRMDDWQFEAFPSGCGWCLSKPWCPKWEAAREGKIDGGAGGS